MINFIRRAVLENKKALPNGIVLRGLTGTLLLILLFSDYYVITAI